MMMKIVKYDLSNITDKFSTRFDHNMKDMNTDDLAGILQNTFHYSAAHLCQNIWLYDQSFKSAKLRRSDLENEE